MACDTTTLLTNAQCWFSCGDRAVNDALEIALLCAIRDGNTSLACNPTALMSEAQCLLSCIPQGAMAAVKLGLLCQIAGSTSAGGEGTTWTIPNGVSSDTVTGLGLSAAPTAVVLTVERRTGAFNLWATMTTTPSADGFSYDLNGVTDTGDYILHIAILP